MQHSHHAFVARSAVGSLGIISGDTPMQMLRAFRFILFICLGAIPWLPAAAQDQPQPTLPIETLQAGIHLIKAEVASQPQQRATGMMFRTAIEPNHGMLFVFDQKAGHCFWMRNTLVPLSIAFVDDDGTVVNVADMEPRSEASHCPERAVRYALEMEQGWFARRGVGPGFKLRSKRLFGN